MIDHDIIRGLLRSAADGLPKEERLVFSAFLRSLQPFEERPKRKGKRKVHSWRKPRKQKPNHPPKYRPQGDLFNGT